MKNCPHCAEEIQDAATVCKHCKTDLQARENQARGAKIFGVILLLMFGGCWWIVQPDTSPEAVAERELRDAKAITATLCESAVTKRLQSPGSADYPFGHVTTVTRASSGQYRLESYVDAQNVFGASIRSRFTCLVSGSGSEISGYKVTRLDIQ